ncbi:MAG: hypothetical protein HY810_06860 [Candidatus Omnitrophica bacterium]|nr:hypothetical protein [Candidatus Omnitrophota bacterium]
MDKTCNIIINLFLLILLFCAVTYALPAPDFTLADEGSEFIVDYEKYGAFKNIGAEKYKYKIIDAEGLAKAVGEGIYPNNKSILKDPQFENMKKKLTGSHWAYVNSPDNQLNFYKWAIAAEAPGIKLFYTAQALEKTGHIKQAIKAYYAMLVHFPESMGLTYWNTLWYVGPAAVDRIEYLTRKYPKIGVKLTGAKMIIKNRYDDDKRNDVFIIDPGKLTACAPEEVIEKPVDLTQLKILQEKKFGDNIKLVEYENGHWQLFVDGKPFMIKALGYQPSKIGQSPDIGTLEDWSFSDTNKNGRIDSPYDAWVDKNKNNIQETDEPAVGDFQLLKDVGANVIRVYHHTFASNKKVFQDLYKNYGIRIIIGDFLGMYAVGSKAPWNPGTN